MSERRSIVEKLLAGEEFDFNKIDDEIDEWHESSPSVSLSEYLGFTRDEYAVYLLKPSGIKSILAARKFGTALAVEQDFQLAARGASHEEIAEIKRWMRSQGQL